MADIANLGFSADTNELVDAKQKLNALVPAAGNAERAAAKLDKTLDGVGASASGAGAKVKQMASGLDVTATSANKAAAGLNNAANASKRAAAGVVAANQNIVLSAGAMKANTANIAAQFQDIGVTAAMGMSPLQIALQQGTQLSAIFAAQAGGLRGVVATLGAAFASVLSPVSLLTIGLVGLTAAGAQMVDWAGLAQTALNAIADILPVIAPYVVAVGAALAVAFAPAVVASIWAVATALVTGVMAAITLIVSTIGAVPILLAAVVAGFITFRDEITQILGFDIVEAAKTGVNIIIGSFVAAYNDIAMIWKNFPNVIGAAAVGAANMAIRAVNAIVAASVSALNRLIASVKTVFKLGGAVGAGMDVEGSLGKVGTGGIEAPKFEEMANPYADALAPALSELNAANKEAIFGTDYVGQGLEKVGKAASFASSKIKEVATGLTAVDAGKAKKGGGGGGKSEGDKFQDIVDGANRSIEAMKAEREAVGLNAEAAARLKYETDLLNQAKQKNIELTPAQREQLIGLAADMANLESETKRAKEALDFTKDATKGFVNDFVSGIRQGKSVWESFVNSALNLANKLIDRGLNAIIDKLFEMNSAASSTSLGGGGGGGFLSGLLGGIGKLFGFAKGGAFPHGIGAHSNSVVDKPTLFAFASGAGVMGEAGPEAIMPLKRGPDGSLGVQMHGANSAQVQPVSPNVEVINNYTIAGAVSEKSIIEQIRATAEQTKRDIKDNVIPWIGEYQRNGIMSS